MPLWVAMEKSLSYKDVYLVPRFSELRSRSNADISVDFLGWKFRAPWVPANMSSVIDEKIAKTCSENGYFYIMHRFGDNRKLVETANHENWRFISISIGVKNEDKEFLIWVAKNNHIIDSICIDVAHGHSILAKSMIEFINGLEFKSHYSPHLNYSDRSFTSVPLRYKPKIIAGNVCTYEAVRDLEKWGADAAKVGIAGGHACSTKNMTGFHIPMFSCVENICKQNVVETYSYCSNYGGGSFTMQRPPIKIPIIADGGIRENGDIAKALVAGATMVMAGGLFAACADAPGENVYPKRYYRKWTSGDGTPNGMWENGPLYKRYYGSASAKQKGSHTHVEGFEIEIPSNNLTYAEKYKELVESLQSAVSYAGGENLEAFKNVTFIRV